MSDKKISLDELRERLKAAGFAPDQGWQKAGGKKVKPAFVEKQVEALKGLRKLLVAQIDADKERLSELHEAKARAKHGGGV